MQLSRNAWAGVLNAPCTESLGFPGSEPRRWSGTSYHDGSNAVLSSVLRGAGHGAPTHSTPLVTLGPLLLTHCTPLHLTGVLAT